jgi:NitT/TauT family transport system ATP-binding protein
MVTHDLREAFELGTRLIVLDRSRHDPQNLQRYGSIVTYDLNLERVRREPPCPSKLLDLNEYRAKAGELRRNA